MYIYILIYYTIRIFEASIIRYHTHTKSESLSSESTGNCSANDAKNWSRKFAWSSCSTSEKRLARVLGHSETGYEQ